MAVTRTRGQRSRVIAREDRAVPESRIIEATLPPPPSPDAEIDLRAPALYINRELSQLALIERVMEEAFDERNPLLERIKFLAICGSLVDEFYETRVAALRDQLVVGQVAEAGRDGLSPT